MMRNWLLGAGLLALLAGCSSSDTDDVVSTTALDVPEASVAGVNNSTATIKWRAVENANQYGWELYKGMETVPESGTCFTTGYSFKMEDGAVYQFRVRALALAGTAYADSEWSEYLTVSSDMLAAPQAELDAESLTDKAAKLSWGAVDGAAAYKYELYESGAGEAVRSASQSGLSVTFDDLKEGTAYRFRVMAVSDSEDRNDSAWSEFVEFTTREVQRLAQPAAKASKTTVSGAALAWEAVTGAVKYAYELREGSLEGEIVKTAETEAAEVVFDDLKESTTYCFRVKALAAADDAYMNDSEYSEAVSFRTRSASAMDLGLPAHEQDGVLRAFPGAEGAGMFTTGGRGGRVIHVTNLNDSGTGSLRDAVKQSGARTVVFDVAGTITLKSSLKIQNPNITIAGQTAPGDGICLRGYGVDVGADNVIIRYLRIRPGDENGNDGLDAIGGRDMQNIIIDHCSMSWSTDECVSFYVNKNMTLQYCLAYESLRNGKHNKGTHGYGGIWGGAPASFHHNILAHHDSRNPRFDGPEQYGDQEQGRQNAKNKGITSDKRLLDFRNNVVYNFCNYPGYGGVGISMNYIGNYYKWGPASYSGTGPSYKMSGGELVKSGSKNCRRQYFFNADVYYNGNGLKVPVQGQPHIYIGDNANNRLDTSVSGSTSAGDGVSADNKKGMLLNKNSAATVPQEYVYSATTYPVEADGRICSVTTHTADEAFDVLTRYCGACLRQDAADTRVLADVKNGTGTSGKAGEMTPAGLERSWNGLIDTPDDKGGYPTLTATDEEIARAATDTDQDGIPDYYEDLLGLDKNNAADAQETTLDPQGIYPNLEIYLHYLVKDITAAQTASGTYAEIK